MAVSINQVAQGIFRVGPLESAGPGRRGHHTSYTSPYIVNGKDKAAVLEPGEDCQNAGTLEALQACGIDANKVAYIWTSHIHMHHIQAVPDLLKALPQSKFVLHPRGAPHVMEPTRLVQQSIEAWGDQCYGPFAPTPKERVLVVEDNQVLDLGGKQLNILYAPGHAPHHMALFEPDTRVLWPGDIGMVHYPGGERGHHDIRPPYFDLEKFLDSIERLRALKPSMLLTFGNPGGPNFTPDKTLRYTAEDHLAIERICYEGLKRKQGFKDIVRKVEEYEDAVGANPGGSRRDSPEFSSGGLSGMIAYVVRKHPELEMPADFSRRMRGG